MKKVLPDGTIVKESILTGPLQRFKWAYWPDSYVAPHPGYPDFSTAQIVVDHGENPLERTVNRIAYRNSNKKTYNPCVHVSSSSTIKCNYIPYWCPYITSTGTYRTYAWDGWVGVSGRTADYFVCEAPTIDIPDFVARAVSNMAPGIKSEMSALVSLWEIKDVISLPSSVFALAKGLLRIIPEGLSFRKVMAMWGKGQLTYTFGIKQLGRDMHAIMNAASRVETAIRDLLDRAGKVNVRHYSEPVLTEKKTKSTSDVSSMITSEEIGTTSWEVRYHCTMKYIYRLIDSNGNEVVSRSQLSKLDAYLDYFGVQWDPGVIWDIIPFSFVVDWFIGVGDWLSSFRRRNIQPQTEIIDCMWSCKATSGTNVTGYYWGQTPWTPGTRPTKQILLNSASYKNVYKKYVRQRCLPPPSSLFGTSPSLKDFSAWKLGAALVVSRL